MPPAVPRSSVLLRPADRHAERRAVAEVARDQLREGVDVDADLTDVVSGQQVQQVMEHRPVRDRHHRLGQEVGERPEPRAEAGGHDHRLHPARPAPREAAASDRSYGARWTPASVTIALTSAAGVTSNAGFRAEKRSLTSRGERSSIGISPPDEALRDRSSTSARRRRTGMRWWSASTARLYVPILFATSPFAAMRSAPTKTWVTSPAP